MLRFATAHCIGCERLHMNRTDFSLPGTRRQLLAGALALAGNNTFAQKKYAPRIVLQHVLLGTVVLDSVSLHCFETGPLKLPQPARQPGQQPARQAPAGGIVWTDEQWNTALSDVQYAGYRRMELLSDTVMGKPAEDILALLNKYGLLVNHVWQGGPLYPAPVAEKTIARVVEVLERSRPLKSPEYFFDPFGDRGPLSDEDARTQNRSLDRIGREAKDAG